jgi:O-antigen/teichoic acid export membrane protein
LIGALITLIGAGITIALNILLIPRFHYLGAAIATFCCYLFMMITSYILGQKYYPVPYPKKKLLAYLALVVLIVLAHRGLVYLWDNRWFNVASATLFLLMFTLFVLNIERKELQKLPLIGRFLKPKTAPV